MHGERGLGGVMLLLLAAVTAAATLLLAAVPWQAAATRGIRDAASLSRQRWQARSGIAYGLYRLGTDPGARLVNAATPAVSLTTPGPLNGEHLSVTMRLVNRPVSATVTPALLTLPAGMPAALNVVLRDAGGRVVPGSGVELVWNLSGNALAGPPDADQVVRAAEAAGTGVLQLTGFRDAGGTVWPLSSPAVVITVLPAETNQTCNFEPGLYLYPDRATVTVGGAQGFTGYVVAGQCTVRPLAHARWSMTGAGATLAPDRGVAARARLTGTAAGTQAVTAAEKGATATAAVATVYPLREIEIEIGTPRPALARVRVEREPEFLGFTGYP